MKKAGGRARGSAAPGDGPAGRARGGGVGWGARAAGLAAVLLLSAAAVAPLVPRGVNPYDEGLLAAGAERVLHGRHPAVHFYSPYGPGVFYVVAAAYRLFGTRLLVERWVAGLLLVLVGGLGYALLAERGAGGAGEEGADAGAAEPPAPDERSALRRLVISAVTGVLITAMLLGAWWYPPVNSGALALLLLSGLALQRGLRTGAPRWAAAAGLCTGGALLWRLTFGAALLAANCVTWLLMSGGPPAARRRRAAGGLAALCGGAMLVALPVYAVLLWQGGHRAVRSLLVWPFVSTGAADLSWPAFSRDPPPGQDSVLAVLAALTHGAGFYYGIAALALVAWRLRQRGLSREDRRLGLWLLLLLPALFLYANGRTDYVHVTPLLTFSLLLGALAVDSGLASAPAGRRRWREIGLSGWIGSLLLLLPTALFGWQHNWKRVGAAPVELPGRRGAGVYAAPHYGRQYRRLLPRIHRCVAPDQALFSGTLRHDLFLTNDNLLYFLAERRPATYFWCLDAGVTTTAPVQRRMIRELARSDTAAAVLWLMPGRGEANAGGQSSGVHLLDRWLRQHFEPRWDPRSLYLLAVPRKPPHP